MARRRLVGAAVGALAAACSFAIHDAEYIGGASAVPSPEAGEASEAGEVGRCSPSGAFGPVTALLGLHLDGADEYSIRFSADEQTALVHRSVNGGPTKLYLATRSGTELQPGTLLSSGVNAPGAVDTGRATWGSNETIFYGRSEAGVPESCDIYSATRDIRSGPTVFGPGAPLGPAVNTSGLDCFPYFAGESLYFVRHVRGDNGLVATVMVASRTSGFDAAKALDTITPADAPVVSRDERTLFFEREDDIWIVRRDTADGAFGEPTNVGAPVSTSEHEEPVDLSADGCTLYLARGRREDGFRRLFSTTRAK